MPALKAHTVRSLDSAPEETQRRYLQWLAWRLDLESKVPKLFEFGFEFEDWRAIESVLIRLWIGPAAARDYGQWFRDDKTLASLRRERSHRDKGTCPECGRHLASRKAFNSHYRQVHASTA